MYQGLCMLGPRIGAPLAGSGEAAASLGVSKVCQHVAGDSTGHLPRPPSFETVQGSHLLARGWGKV